MSENNEKGNSCNLLCVYYVSANHYEHFIYHISFILTNLARKTLLTIHTLQIYKLRLNAFV